MGAGGAGDGGGGGKTLLLRGACVERLCIGVCARERSGPKSDVLHTARPLYEGQV